ncbi:ribonuclease E/G [uncultured Tateyamaria sp.]|uniref:ribonuclease E/G n=1 Tax=Tateyamaria sp. 1078 TaxID=3417464 RepID=UPI002631F3A8|nr:ribonuclease E/G [uncultured Tateyamaria sp.]
MKGHQIILGDVQGREAAALITDGVLQDLIVDADAPRPGTIYRAKATRPVKGQGGMFFDTPEGSAFLRGAKGLAPGDMRLVQVSGYAEPGKAIPVTDRILIKSRYAIATPDAPGINISRSIRDEEVRVALRATADAYDAELGTCGLIVRSAAADANLDAVAEDIEHVVAIALAVVDDAGTDAEKLIEGPGPQELAWRDWPTGAPEQGDLAPHLTAALRADVSLPGGGSLWVENTRAFVAVDVNTGSDTSPAAGLKANIAAARDLPRVLRLKGLGGQIVVDFAPMPKKERRALENALRVAFKPDAVETSLLGWTTLGHFELTRKRARAPLSEVV